MDLTKKITNYLRSGFQIFWLKTTEPLRVKRKLYNDLRDIVRKDGAQYKVIEWSCATESNPMLAVQKLEEAEEFTILFCYNFHWFSKNPQVIQAIQDLLPVWASQGKAIVFVSPIDAIPLELKADTILLDMPLPDSSEIERIINHSAPNENLIPKGAEMESLISACKGLTSSELEQILSLSLVESDGKGFRRMTINEHKSSAVNKTGFLTIIKPAYNFSAIIGYNVLKDFILDTANNPKAKGIIAIGPSGTGKTSLMKAIVGETGKLGIAINMGSLFSKYQGETDQNVNFVIDFLTNIGNCFVLIDEFEKQFSGAASDGTMDSGTTKRATSRWLDFLQDRPEGIYICGTANSFIGIPGEYLRPGRWDSSPFYVGLPDSKTKKAILKYYMEKTGLEMPKTIPTMDKYSGAEIEAMVHIASMRNLSLDNASMMIKAMATVKSQDYKELENWAKDCAVDANEIPSSASKLKRKIDM